MSAADRRADLEATVFAFHRDTVKIMEMLMRAGEVHPATMQFFADSALKLHDDVLALYASLHPGAPPHRPRRTCCGAELPADKPQQ